MADAADEPTLRAFPEFPGEAMSKRCGATRERRDDDGGRRDGAMDARNDGWRRATRREEDDDDGDGTVDARLTTHAAPMVTTAQ